ncbi:MAG: cytochrome c biogenesis protein ResB [Candidatus Eremiobacteraeota bacterium]|nr:cytochrome c biogenesis protein ResB [Candidatus Eremiobacteraeota bacterium]
MASLAPTRSTLAAAYDDFLRTFSNVLFAVCLFVIWGLLTLIGVIVDQNKDSAVYFAAYAAPIARMILRLGFDNIYHSPAYVGIIGLILLSLAVCTFKRVIPARLPALRPVKIDKIPLHASFSMHGDEATLRGRIDAFFAARGWQVRKREFGGEEWTFADKHNWARRGVLVAHIGFVIIAAGTSVYWARGFSGDAAVLEGQTIAIPHTDTAITLHDFKYRIEPIATKSGIVYQPVDYLSNVTVSGKNVPSHDATIRVNHPIDIDGTLFYQSSYGFGMRFAVMHDGKPVPDLSNLILKEGEALTLPQSSRQIQYSQFVGTIDRASGMPSADPRTNNPGVVLNALDDGQPVGATLVPLGKRIDVGDGFSIVPRQYVMYSGLQYRYDPGIPLVGIGAFVLLAGLCISFYLLPARLYVKMEQTVEPGATPSQAWTVGIAATTVKGYDIFERQFAELAVALQTEAAS